MALRVLIAGAFLSSQAALPTNAEVPPSDASLPPEVQAVLAEHCFKCHGPKKQSGKLDLRTVDSILAGGKRGPAMVAAEAEASRLIQFIQPGAKPHMPPGKQQLSHAEITVLTDWISGLSPLEAVSPATATAAHQGVSAAISVHANPTTVIDLLIQDGYGQEDFEPNPRCTDRQFVRRIYLDLVGRIPTVKEAREFLRETESNKRERLVDHLLDSEAFPRHMSECFDTMLLGRDEKKLSARKQHGWHAYLEDVFKNSKPWDEVAREVLLARGSATARGHLWFLYEHDDKHQQLAESIARGFFGVDIACAQCHDHPLAGEIKQAHYWGLVAFFNRSKNAKTEHGLAISESAIGGFNEFANALSGTTEPARLTFLGRGVVEEQRPDEVDKQEDSEELYLPAASEPRVPIFSRREKFVDEILNHHPLLARAIVNRLWALLVGRGLIHPIDEMDSQHPASHPQLLDWLARDFERHGCNVRRLIRSIVLTQTYQLDSRRSAHSPEPSRFAYALEKPLSAEVWARSIRVALGVDESATSGLLPDFRAAFPEVVSENGLTTLKQTLLLSNHPEVQAVCDIAAKRWSMRAADAPEMIDAWFEQVLCRLPDTQEKEMMMSYLSDREDRRPDAVRQALWTLITSAEFRFNH